MSSEPSQELESDTTEYSEGTADSGRRGFGTDSEYFTLRRGSSSGIPESAEWVDPEPPEWVEPVPVNIISVSVVPVVHQHDGVTHANASSRAHAISVC